MMKARPIVAISRVSSRWPSNGRSTSRSVAMPTTTMTPIAMGTAIHIGTPNSMTPTSVMAAKNTNEACAKLNTDEAL